MSAHARDDRNWRRGMRCRRTETQCRSCLSCSSRENACCSFSNSEVAVDTSAGAFVVAALTNDDFFPIQELVEEFADGEVCEQRAAKFL